VICTHEERKAIQINLFLKNEQLKIPKKKFKKNSKNTRNMKWSPTG
jgi:hypothetical protein